MLSFTIKANQAMGRNAHTDSTAREVLTPEQAAAAIRAQVTAVGCYHRSRNKLEWRPDLFLSVGRLVDPRWEVTLLTDHIMIWSPLTEGLFGGPKVKPGQATHVYFPLEDVNVIRRDGEYMIPAMTTTDGSGNVVRVNVDVSIDEVPSSGPFVLTLWTDVAFDSDASCLELDFADAASAGQFCTALATRVTAYWAGKAEVSRVAVANGLGSRPGDALLHADEIREGTANVAAIEAELSKLISVDWADPHGRLSISVAAAGWPMQPA